MAKANYSGLSDWFLAKLRQKAARRDEGRMTPHTLVETDANLIKDMVSKAAVSRERRTHQLAEELRKINKNTRVADIAIIWASLVGVLCFAYILIRSFL